jgi:hypothetical protein
VDRYTLATPTWNTSNWISGGNGTLASTRAARPRPRRCGRRMWRLAPSLKATLGARYEWWRAFDGRNVSTSGNTVFAVNQPQVSHNGLSPKASLAWALADDWMTTLSTGRALRFPTVGELYQNVLLNGVYLQANPNLKPEKVWSTELAIEKQLQEGQGKWRISLFEERVSDALISQSSTIGSGVASYTQNVDRTRQRGIEPPSSATICWCAASPQWQRDLGGCAHPGEQGLCGHHAAPLQWASARPMCPNGVPRWWPATSPMTAGPIRWPGVTADGLCDRGQYRHQHPHLPGL